MGASNLEARKDTVVHISAPLYLLQYQESRNVDALRALHMGKYRAQGRIKDFHCGGGGGGAKDYVRARAHHEREA